MWDGSLAADDCIHAWINACPHCLPDGALPAMMSCTRRWGMVNRRSNRSGSCSKRFGLL